MAAKKKTRSNQRKSKTSAASKRPVKKASKKKLAVKTKARKKLATKRAAQRTAVPTANAKRKKTTTVKTARDIEEQIQDKNRSVYAVGSSGARQGRVYSGRQSGDLQGLSQTEEADSESVDELLEEGNPFEAEVVTGVEEADEADEKEVRTHEVPEDDVPDEYLNKD
jgi:diaminopimelate epimerase